MNKFIIYKRKQHGGKFNLYDKNLNGYELSDQDIMAFNLFEYASTYGEITRDGLKEMLKGINTQDKIYYDLGSGLGKSVIWAAVDHNMISNGIELSNNRHEKALFLLSQVPDQFKDRIKLFNDDILKKDISNGNVIFISNLCFPQHVNSQLTKKVSQELQPGSIIFCSKELDPNPKLKLIKTMPIEMSWSPKSDINQYIIQ